MKVWVVSEGIDYEGLLEPEKAFDSAEKAVLYIKAHKNSDYWDITEIEVE
jgi:hypothetical protein